MSSILNAVTKQHTSKPPKQLPLFRFDDLPDSGFIRAGDLFAYKIVPFSAATLWRKVRASTFPPTQKLGMRITAFRVANIRAWLADPDNYCAEVLSVMIKHTQPNIEQRLRARRTAAFKEATGLKPKPFGVRKFGKIYTEVKALCRLDHITYWESYSGAVFMLNEPYGDEMTTVQVDVLLEAGYVLTVVPVNMNCYCGVFNPEIGALPQTIAYLITSAQNGEELKEIAMKLHEADINAPAWNDVNA